jgi:biotin carboxyl carrier protein
MANKNNKVTKREKLQELDELSIDNLAYKTLHTRKYLSRKPYTPPIPGLLTAFIPGTIIDVFVKEGQQVNKGDKLVTLEAMKMLNEIRAPFDGIVKTISVQPGDKVTKNCPLIDLE